MDRIDEMNNEYLARWGHSDHVLRAEAERVSRLIKQRALTGDDLSYWLERSRVLNSLIRSGSRAG